MRNNHPRYSLADYTAHTSDRWGEAMARYIPEHMQSGLSAYILDGCRPGGFLRSVLANDLKGAVGRADTTNSRLLAQYIYFLTNGAPWECWGNPTALKTWTEHKGLLGLRAGGEEYPCM